MDITPVFRKMHDAWMQHPRFIDSAGGTRSGKTFAALQLLILLAESDKKPTLTSVVSETLPHLKRGAIRDFRTLMGDTFNEEAYNRGDNIYTFTTGSQLEFFSADQPSKVHGPARDRLFINEAVNVDYDTARQLFVRTRDFIILDYNPTHSFWVHEHIQPREGCVSILSTYKDNPFLSAQQVEEIEAGRGDAYWWRVYGEGLVGMREGIIYDFRQIDKMPDAAGMVELYGLDFGFTNDPTACVRVLCDTRRKALYIDEICYGRGMLNDDIADALGAAGVKRHSLVYADCSEPRTIAELNARGYNVRPCYKATRKAEQVNYMRSWEWNITKTSTNVIREARAYAWQTDRDGNSLNEPSPFNDHAMDAIRYAVFTHHNATGNGNYNITLR